MSDCPEYWKTTPEEIDQQMLGVKKGKRRILCVSPGGRPVYAVFYGKENQINRTANLSSALGAGDPGCFVNRNDAAWRPTLLLAGCIHGGEFEGTAALLNLISVMESGTDLAGDANAALLSKLHQINLLILPCVNPDGRSHVPFATMVGRSFEELRYYNQGTWPDGSLCGWPECKKIHPIKGKVGYLGGYFNDDGVNLMHDNFFGKKAAETEALLQMTEAYAPDFSVLLHGGTNGISHLIAPTYAPPAITDEVVRFGDAMRCRCLAENLPFAGGVSGGEDQDPPVSFNLISAMYHLCGAPCITYESNQGLTDGETDVSMTHAQIYRQHWILFETLCDHLLDK